jgi:hypothetical protein
MTDKLVTAVQAYLHPLERVKIAIEAGLPDKKLKRYLAVVTNETGKSKEAAYVNATCVIVAIVVVRARKDLSTRVATLKLDRSSCYCSIFVFKGDSKSLLLETAIPICGNFIYRKGMPFCWLVLVCFGVNLFT